MFSIKIKKKDHIVFRTSEWLVSSSTFSPVFHCGLEPLKGESLIDLTKNSHAVLDGIIDDSIKITVLMFFYHFYSFLYFFSIIFFFLLIHVSKCFAGEQDQAKWSQGCHGG